nr:MAG TPA: hypothetical protein [Caudoviricetes sp.]
MVLHTTSRFVLQFGTVDYQKGTRPLVASLFCWRSRNG